MHVAFKGHCCSHLLMAFRAGWLLELCLRDGAGRGGDGPGDISPGFWKRGICSKKSCLARQVWDAAAVKLGKGKEEEIKGRMGENFSQQMK